MKYEKFLKYVDFHGWLFMNGLETRHVATNNGSYILLLYRKNLPYGMSIEAFDRLQGRGYDIITDIPGLPEVIHEIIPENTTMTRVMNAKDYHDIAI